MVKWFCKDVSCIVIRTDTSNREFIPGNHLANGMIPDADMFHSRVPDMVLGKDRGCDVVTINWCGRRGEEVKGVKDSPEESGLMSRFMEGDIFCIARGIGDKALFLRRPRNHARSKGEAVSANRTAVIGAIGIV